MSPEDYHAAQMARTPPPALLSERQFDSGYLEARARRIKHRALRVAYPRLGNVQPYLPSAAVEVETGEPVLSGPAPAGGGEGGGGAPV